MEIRDYILNHSIEESELNPEDSYKKMMKGHPKQVHIKHVDGKEVRTPIHWDPSKTKRFEKHVSQRMFKSPATLAKSTWRGRVTRLVKRLSPAPSNSDIKTEVPGQDSMRARILHARKKEDRIKRDIEKKIGSKL